jgi:small-conductance mechanosensitive channel/CRP-like cAMP-binding protein
LTQFLETNLTLVVGAVLLLLLLALRAAAQDATFRRDLRGAISFLIAFVALRAGYYFLESVIPTGVGQAMRVAWMLTFAFGTIRALVSCSLWAVRRFGKTPVPKILRDVIDFSLYGLATFPILKSQLNVDLTGLLATSAILSVVLGLALQETLGNLFAGLALQLERPFQVGDYVTVGDYSGRVVQLAWRAIRIETFRREVVTVPNNIVAKQGVLNFSRGFQPVGVDLYVGISYSAPPNKVRQVVLEMLGEIPLVLREPPPRCRTWQYDESSLRYQIRYFVSDYAQSDNAKDEIYSRLWYRLGREGIEIPFPQRTLHLRSEEGGHDVSAARRELVGTVDLFSALPPDERERVARELSTRRFGEGEKVIGEGDAGHTFYMVASGQVSVRVGKAEAEVARLSRGQYFGEMSLLTGEARTATVVALNDAVLLELDRPIFARLFSEYPGLAKQLSALLAQRRSQLKALTETAGAPIDSTPEAGRIFTRLRQIFGLRGD